MKNTQKYRIMFLFTLFVFMIYFISGTTQWTIHEIEETQKPECHVSSYGCNVNGGQFGYDENGNCYCDMSNAPTPEPSNPPTCEEGEVNLIGCVPAPKEDKEPVEEIKKQETSSKSQEEECKYKGCFLNGLCYTLGGRVDNLYCKDITPLTFPTGYSISLFVNQSEIGIQCNQNYECKTNLCYKGFCTSLDEVINRQVNARVEELKTEIVNEMEEQTNNLNEGDDTSIDIVDEKIVVNKSVIEKFLNWFKRLFG